MNREEAKALLPIIKAFSEGKVVQKKCAESWVKVEEDCDFHFPASYYRIKPELKYRPFKDTEECWNVMLKHQPFGWLKVKDSDEYYNYSAVSSSSNFTLDFKEYVFADGTPFGIEEEE